MFAEQLSEMHDIFSLNYASKTGLITLIVIVGIVIFRWKIRKPKK
ncbi:hypothetical protein LCGC14_1757470 [marine sediment metagenome]|uniref:Uncharacterized protein n=1 Tax=marine sediment metagenome TaxID=412755 RepID=A0A0F9HPC2_9ZZZZ